MTIFTATPSCILEPPSAAHIEAGEHEALLGAAIELERCQHALARVGLNVVGELLRGHDGFFEMTHYPDDDVYDRESQAQYYYHAHREDPLEHGHFHTFVRVPQTGSPEHTPVHLIAVSMDGWGKPIGLFACNRWVTGETFYPAEAIRTLLPAFRVDHAYPSWPTNLWLTALLRLFRPHIEALLKHRDEVIADWQRKHPDRDALEDRALEITGYLPVSVDGWLASLHGKLRAE